MSHPKDAMKAAAALARQQFESRPRPVSGGSYLRTKDGVKPALAPAPAQVDDAGTESAPKRKGKEQ